MITIQNIADKAGVSKCTVSYVLNGKQEKARINSKTCAKVIAIAESLGYRRNAIAQSMKTGKTNVIGLVGEFEYEYGAEIVKGITQFAGEKSYSTKFFYCNKRTDIAAVGKSCVEQRLAGVICRSLNEDQQILYNELSSANIPIVLVDNSFPHDWCSRVISNDFEGAKLAVNYLYKLGHRKISHITTSLTRGFAKIRYEGFCAAMKEHNLDLPTHSMEIDDEYSEITEVFVNRVKKVLKEYKPTAIFCSSDPLAMKVLKIATESGIKIPSELSVIGFAGMSYTQWTSPALTTIEQPFAKMGKTVTKILLSEIKNKTPIQEVKLPVDLIVRESCQKNNILQQDL